MRRSLALLATAGLLPIVALGAVFAAETLHNERISTEQRAHTHAQFAATLIAGRLDADRAEVRLLADGLETHTAPNDDGARRLANRVLSEHSDWRTVSIADPGGRQTLDLPAVGHAGRVDDEASFRLAIQTRAPVVGQVLRDSRGELAFAVRSAVIRDGQVISVVSTMVRSETLRDLLCFQPLPSDWRASVVDGAGFVIASSSLASVGLGHRATRATLLARSRGVQGLYQYRRHDGIDAAAVFVPIRGTDWTLHVSAPARYYSEPTRQAFAIMASAAAVCLLLFLVLAKLLALEMRQYRLRENAALQGQRMEALGRLTGGVAHDFNNLLTPIVGGLDLLRRQVTDNAKALRYIDAAMTSADRARTLVGRLLAFSRRQTLAPRDVDLANLLTGLSDLLERSLRPAVDVRVEIPPGLPPVHADPAQLELAILNLAINARDAMPAGGEVSISARIFASSNRDLAAGDYIAIAIADTGIGMDEATRQQAIDPFFTTKPAERGTGLGLSMVHGFAAQSGGALQLSSIPGSGTVATIILPKGKNAPATIDQPREAATPAPRTVLLVDDDESVRTATAEMLRDGGHRVWEAESVDQALHLLGEQTGIDVVVTDYLMPGRTGGDLVRALGSEWPHLPILLITGYIGTSGDVPSNIPRVGKPFHAEELLEGLATAIRLAA